MVFENLCKTDQHYHKFSGTRKFHGIGLSEFMLIIIVLHNTHMQMSPKQWRKQTLTTLRKAMNES